MTIVRNAIEDDFESIIAIADYSPFQPTDEAGRTSIRNHIQEGRALLALVDAAPDLTPAGYLLWRPHLWDGRPPFIEHIDVLPDFRKEGVGRALIEELEQVARKLGFDAIYSSTGQNNIVSQAFHERLGFEQDVLYKLRDQPDEAEIMLSKKLS